MAGVLGCELALAAQPGRIQLACLDRGANGAAGLTLVPAVGKATVPGQRDHVREQLVQAILDTMHARFISVVRESRPGLDPARVPQLTDGRIFDAPQAVAAGLVDEIGDLRHAIGLAERAAGIEKARVVMYHRMSESRDNIYSAAGGLPAQVNVMPIDLGMLELLRKALDPK